MATLYCEKCGAELEVGSRFCANCGSTAAACPQHMETTRDVSRDVERSFGQAAEKTKRRGLVARLLGPRARASAPECVDAGEELTVVFDPGSGAAGFCDTDGTTTTLSSEPIVSLDRLGTGKTFSHDLPFIVGKGAAADVQIVGNPTVSRRHARFFSQGGDVMLEDLGSTNKTKVNGIDVARGMQVRVEDGDILLISDETFAVHVRFPEGRA